MICQTWLASCFLVFIEASVAGTALLKRKILSRQEMVHGCAHTALISCDHFAEVVFFRASTLFLCPTFAELVSRECSS